MSVDYANLDALQQIINLAQQQATAAYEQGLIQHQNDQLAYDQARDAADRVLSQAQISGFLNGAPTLAAGQLLGTFNGQPTLPAQEALGMINGQPTLANIGQQNTLATNFLDILSRLQGPANAFQYAKVLQSTPQGLRDIVNAAAGRFRMSGYGGGQVPSPATMQGADLNTLVGAATGQPGGVSGQPAVGSAPGAGSSASMPVSASPLVQSSSAVGPLNQFGTAGPAPGTQVTSIAPGQSGTSTVSHQFGIGPASQEFGYGPGKGAQQVAGMRGLGLPTATGLGAGHVLSVPYQFLTSKAPGSYLQLKDMTAGGRLISQAPIQGSSGTATLALLDALDPSHQYNIFPVLPAEGGAAGGMEVQFTPGQLQMQQSPQADAAAQAVRNYWATTTMTPNSNFAYEGADIFNRTLGAQQATPAQPASAAATAAPAASTADTSPATIPDFGALPPPNQIDPLNYSRMTPSQKSLLLGAYQYQGWDPNDVENLLKQSLPKYTAPTAGSVVMR
jgi:hypothetical protein